MISTAAHDKNTKGAFHKSAQLFGLRLLCHTLIAYWLPSSSRSFKSEWVVRRLVRSGRHQRIIVVFVVLEWVPVPVTVEVCLRHAQNNLCRDWTTWTWSNLWFEFRALCWSYNDTFQQTRTINWTDTKLREQLIIKILSHTSPINSLEPTLS